MKAFRSVYVYTLGVQFSRIHTVHSYYSLFVNSTVGARLVSEMFNLRMRGGHASNKLSMVGTVTLCDVKRSVAVSAMLDILLYLASRVFTLPLTGD